MFITEIQKDNLKGFFLYMWNYYHNKEDEYYQRDTNDFEFYAQKLDGLNISWLIQNNIAHAASDRNNGFIYFSTILKNLKIEVIK